MFQPGLFNGKRILVTGAGWQTNSGCFDDMLKWGDAEWEQARALIQPQRSV